MNSELFIISVEIVTEITTNEKTKKRYKNKYAFEIGSGGRSPREKRFRRENATLFRERGAYNDDKKSRINNRFINNCRDTASCGQQNANEIDAARNDRRVRLDV